MHSVFILGIPLALAALAAAAFVERRELRQTIAEQPKRPEPIAAGERAQAQSAAPRVAAERR
jgi:hypothetical protein